MTNEKDNNAAAPPGDEFAHLYADYVSARDRLSEAKQKLAEADARQVAAINELPEDQRADMAQLEIIADRLNIAALGDAVFQGICDGDPKFQAMATMPAPTHFALFLKLEAIVADPFNSAPWEDGLITARILADAATLNLELAKAWVDRWRALGGTFGSINRNGEAPHATRGMVVDLDYWQPTDRGNPELPPHAWLLEPEHHHGAVKVLEGFLHLVPGLQEAVFAVVGPTIPGLEAEIA